MTDMELIGQDKVVITWRAASKSHPGIFHEVRFDIANKFWWCGCPGFQFKNRCRHIPGGGYKDEGSASASVRSDGATRDTSRSRGSPHLALDSEDPLAIIKEQFKHVRAGCEALAKVDPDFRDAIQHRHSWRMAFKIMEQFGTQIVPPDGMTVRELADHLPSAATIIRWTLPMAKQLQTLDQLAKGQELKAAHAWVATHVENGQARLGVE